ncbi:uncharacterized protein LODBEIA_P30050 [Lodderomyces beijingensis]|uniref:Uncharacterized protein n=1 Tax=Lodderomyces beijingensis TaxID=1775926 RepID=A0ABP0ZNU0_9ASCO
MSNQSRSSGSAGKQQSPLAQLRLSNIESEQTLPKETRRKQDVKSQAVPKPIQVKNSVKRGNSYYDREVQTARDNISSTAASSATAVSAGGATDHAPEQLSKEDVKRAAELSSLFVDTRNLLQADCNVLSPTPRAEKEAKSGPKSNSPTITRNTIIRAEKVKTMLGLKYLFIQRIYDWEDENGDTNKHPGVEGVYNPLQILRNRKIRAKYGEYPKPFHSKTIPLACNVFSRHNIPEKHHRKEWRMLWAIELNEFVSDPRWRVNHWHELKDPKGNLWFPRKEEEESQDVKRHRHRFRHRLHDRLFESSDEERSRSEEKQQSHHHHHKHHQSRSQDQSQSRGRRQRHSEASNDRLTGSDTDVHLLKFSRSKSPTKRGLRSRVKKFYQGDSSSSSNILNSFRDADAADKNESSMNLGLPNPTIDNSDHSGEEEQRPASSGGGVGQVTPPTILVDTSNADANHYNIQDVQFQSSRRNLRENDSDAEALDHSDGQDEDIHKSDSKSNEDEELAKLFTFLNYFHQCCENRTGYLLNLYPAYLQLLQGRVDKITGNSIYELLQQMTSVLDDNLPAYDDLYQGFLEETKSILHMANENYSIKIDTLLSTSDRSISELNASLPLELRKTGERLEILEASLFNKTIKTELIHEATNYKVFYFLLENLIVILLKLVWIFVNIYKFFAFFVRIGWKMISVFIFE